MLCRTLQTPAIKPAKKIMQRLFDAPDVQTGDPAGFLTDADRMDLSADRGEAKQHLCDHRDQDDDQQHPTQSDGARRADLLENAFQAGNCTASGNDGCKTFADVLRGKRRDPGGHAKAKRDH